MKSMKTRRPRRSAFLCRQGLVGERTAHRKRGWGWECNTAAGVEHRKYCCAQELVGNQKQQQQRYLKTIRTRYKKEEDERWVSSTVTM